MPRREPRSVTGVEAVGAYTLLRVDRGELDPGGPGQFFMLEAPGRIMSRRPAEGDYDETPAHKVTITYPFRISREEVTIEQFRRRGGSALDQPPQRPPRGSGGRRSSSGSVPIAMRRRPCSCPAPRWSSTRCSSPS